MNRAVVVLMVVLGCSKSVEPTETVEADPIAVETLPLEFIERPRVLVLEGTLQANRRAQISPLVSGHVQRVAVERGDVVSEGDTLLVLRAQDYRLAAQAASARADAQLESLGIEGGTASDLDPDTVASVAAARADWEAKQDLLTRSEPLATQGVIDPQTLQQTRAAALAARARYDQARQQVSSSLSNYRALRAEASLRRSDASDATVRAPFDGAVVDRMVEVGEFVGPQTPVVELVDASSLRLELDVPERESTSIQVGQHVSIAVDGTDEVLDGTVRFVAAALDTDRRTLTIEAVVENPEGRIRAGHFARARLQLNGTRRLMEVPRGAIVSRAGVSRIYVVSAGVADAYIVEVVDEDTEHAYIEGDLPEDAVIVSAPPRELSDGAAVTSSARAAQPPAAQRPEPQAQAEG